jgi:hypothetical protein
VPGWPPAGGAGGVTVIVLVAVMVPTEPKFTGALKLPVAKVPPMKKLLTAALAVTWSNVVEE